MKTEPLTALRHATAADAQLRADLCATLSDPPGPDVHALEDRVLAQWRLRGAVDHPVAQGRGSTLILGTRAKSILAGVTVLVLVAALGLQQIQKQSQAPMDELAEPDVLSLISLGEL
jgi:hypothetical protein